ncbi:MAG: hypothetical protein EOL89_02600 [Actinobacteria bacterium]|nr:hypothetical protein [Actinomycetota bacterium]
MNKLPQAWRNLPLVEIAGRPQYGWTSSARPDAGGKPLLRTTDITRGSIRWGHVPRATNDPPDLSRYLLSHGDIVVSRAGSVGVSALIHDPPEAIFASYLMRLRPGPEVSPEFLAHYLTSPQYWRQISSVTNGIAIPNINGSKLSAIDVPVPPLEEQRRIVAILDDHLSRLDAATSAAWNSVRRLSALRLSALTTARDQLVGEGAVMRPLGAVAQTALGKMLDAKREAGTPTPYLRNINVRWGSFELDDIQEVPLSTDERERLALEKDDLLVCEGGEPGRCAVWPGSESLVAYQKALHRVRTYDPQSVDVHFLAVMLEEFIKAGRADWMFTGTTIKHLPQEKLRLVELPIPTLERQRAVLRSLDSLNEGTALLENELGKVQSRAASLRRSLLTAAFSGQLTSQHELKEGVA